MPRKKQMLPKKHDDIETGVAVIMNEKEESEEDDDESGSKEEEEDNQVLDLSCKRSKTSVIKHAPPAKKLKLEEKCEEASRSVSPFDSVVSISNYMPLPPSLFTPVLPSVSLHSTLFSGAYPINMNPLLLPPLPPGLTNSRVNAPPIQEHTTSFNDRKRSSGALDHLSSLVQKVGTCNSSAPSPVMACADSSSTSSCGHVNTVQGMNTANGTLSMQDLWWKYMKKEESAELKRLNEAKQIFTCMQCRNSFQCMEQLVNHMQVSGHFAKVPSMGMQQYRQKLRNFKMKLKYSDRMVYFCRLCSSPFTTSVHQHFSEEHKMHNPVHNMNYVQVVNSSSIPCTVRTPSASSTSSQGTSPAHSPKTVLSKTLSPVEKPAKHNNDLPLAPSEANQNDNALTKMEQLIKSAIQEPTAKNIKTKMKSVLDESAKVSSHHEVPLPSALLSHYTKGVD